MYKPLCHTAKGLTRTPGAGHVLNNRSRVAMRRIRDGTGQDGTRVQSICGMPGGGWTRCGGGVAGEEPPELIIVVVEI